MKKILSILLILSILFSFAACGLDDSVRDQLGQVVSSVQDSFVSSVIDDLSEDLAKITEATAPQSEEPVTEAPTESLTDSSESPTDATEPSEETPTIAVDGTYTSKEDVALYIHVYGKLPQNFISKKEAQKLGWSGGSLEGYAPGKSIGGDHFGNYEGKLPEAKGRSYTECDIDTLGAKSRGAKRIVFSNDGLIYYTEDHYETFELLYGEE